jgi:hypothetical protein
MKRCRDSEPDTLDIIDLTKEAESPLNLKTYNEQLQDIIETVLQNESHLLPASDLLMLGIYSSLTEDAKELYFKLLNHRQFKYHRLTALIGAYPTIAVECAAKELENNQIQFIHSNCNDQNSPPELNQLFSLLLRHELDKMAASNNISTKGLKKPQLIETLMSYFTHHLKLSNEKIIEKVIELTGPFLILDESCRNTFHAIFVIYHRSFEWPADDKFLLDSILTNSTKESISRHYYPYKVVR